MTPIAPINKGAIEGIAPLLQVFDMPTSLTFYRDVLGFTVQDSSGEGDDVGWVLLTLNNFILMLNTAYDRDERPSSPDPDRLAGHQDFTLYLGYPDIDAYYEYLSGKGVKVNRPQITQYNWKAIHFFDPDGYPICFHWPVK
jgi:glyoxylase I family protein